MSPFRPQLSGSEHFDMLEWGTKRGPESLAGRRPSTPLIRTTGKGDTPMLGASTKSHKQRIVLARIKLEANDCWTWTNRLNREGYGQVNTLGKVWSAHRFSYEAFVGPIPDGLTIDHLCRNRACVNPEHLEPVSNAENIRRGFIARGYDPAARQRPKRPYLSRDNVSADDPRHGTRSGYNNLNCRCDPCREAARAYRRPKKASA